MPKPSATRYRTTNWSAYNAALRRRGSLSVWFDPDTVWHAGKTGKRGRPETFSNAAVQVCLTLKVLFGLPRRRTVGLVESLIRMAGLDWPVPDYSTRCRRQARIGGAGPVSPFGQALEPADRQHRHQVPWRWRMVGPQARAVASQAMAQGPHRHGHGDRRHTGGRVHLEPPWGQPSATGASGANSRGRRNRHSDR